MTHTPEEIELVANALWGMQDTHWHEAYNTQAATLLDALAALRPTPALDALAMQRAEPEKFHYYAMSFQSFMVGKAISASVYIGWPDMNITKDRIQEAKDGAAVPATAVLIGASYLGHMTREEMTGETLSTPEAQRLAPQIGVLVAERMKREAAQVCDPLMTKCNCDACNSIRRCRDAILALPTGYTDAQLDAEAMARPKVRAVVDARRAYLAAVNIYNAKHDAVMADRKAGIWGQGLNAEREATEEAQAAFIGAACAMADAALKGPAK